MARGNGPPVVLAFGGLDPTGGAGVTMDAKAIHAAGGYAAVVPSCLAVQTTATFSRIVGIPRKALDESLACAEKSFPLRAVKIGMVGTRGAAEAILSFLDSRTRPSMAIGRSCAVHGARDTWPSMAIVLDPVLRSSSGGLLLSPSALPAYRKLLARATVLTPNLPEIEKILDRRIGTFEEAVASARDLAEATAASVVLKGGHFPWRDKRGTDIVCEAAKVTVLPPAARSPRPDAHGTGCALASAIAARLAAGDRLVDAVRKARSLVTRWVRSGFPSSEGRWTLFTR